MGIKLKVCGMRDPKNIAELMEIRPDFMGMIFYPKSPRFVSDVQLVELPEGMTGIGVFVNASPETILEKAGQYGLKYIQLHGDEDEELAKKIKSEGLGVIKVFRLEDELPVDKMKYFDHLVDFFLFDTKTTLYGGSGKRFDWEVLKDYPFDTPYFLSGGIDLEDVAAIRKLDLPKLFAIDVNSRFETQPGLKDIDKIKKLKALL